MNNFFIKIGSWVKGRPVAFTSTESIAAVIVIAVVLIARILS